MANMKARYTDTLEDILTFIDNYTEALGYIPPVFELLEALRHLYQLDVLEAALDDILNHVNAMHKAVKYYG
jgi:hypothetical protein